MGWINLIVGSYELKNDVKAYINAVNDISTFVETTPQKNHQK